MSFRCVHIADIHFRGLSRHDQYRAVFEDFFEKMKEEKPDVIFVGGDIVHSKTQGISPELIDILNWWFKGLSKSAKFVHVILGNHDGLILNDGRQDTISPIITALALPNVFLHKKSGTYPSGIKGYNFSVFSCFDEAGWKNVYPLKGDINIACYHGAVVGSLTDIDWEIEGELEASFFDRFDFTFLGDIHRLQFIGKDRRIAYCGSTIQQNFGEDVTKGYLLWDIKSKDSFLVDFRPLKNPNPFVTIEWKSSTKDTLAGIAIPSGAHVRVQSKRPIEQTSWNHLRALLKENYCVKEIVHDLRREDQKQDASLKGDEKTEDYRDISVLMKHVTKWLETIIQDPDELKDAMAYLKKIRSSVPEPDCLRNVKWSIDSIEFDNTFSYGEDNRIDFSELRGVAGIFGKNATGKSSIPGTILYALFNGSDRGALKNVHIINARKPYCKASADITVNGKHYRIERQTVKHQNKAGEIHAPTHVNMFETDGHGVKTKDLAEEQRRETERTIRSLIGNAENFLMTSFASQGEMNNFIKEKATNRKSILNSFLDFSIFEDLNRISRQDLIELKGKLASVPSRDFATLEREKATDIELLKSELEEISKKSLGYSDRLASVQARLAVIPTNIVTKADVLLQETLIKEIKSDIASIESQKERLISEISEKSKKLAAIENILLQNSKAELVSRLSYLTGIKDRIASLSRLISENTTHEKILKKSVSALDDVPCGDMFKSCKFIVGAHESKEELKLLQEKVATIQLEIDGLKNSFDESEIASVTDAINKIDKLSKLYDDLKRDITLKSSLELAAEKLNLKTDRLHAENETLEKLKLSMSDDAGNEKLDMLKREKMEIEALIRTNDSKKMSLATLIGKQQSDFENLLAEKKKFESLTREWKTIELISEATSKKGVPLVILGAKLPQLNSEIAQILQGATNFAVELEVDLESNAMDIYINYGDSRRIIECASGMEKMMASLAIRVALINITNLPKCDVLLIDEGFGALDDMNIESCTTLLHNLKKWFKTIMIISHIDAVKDTVDNLIEISKKGVDSYVNTTL